MPRAKKVANQYDRAGRLIITPENMSPRIRAQLENQGRWVAWDETGKQVVASAETFEELDDIAQKIRAASQDGISGAIVEYIEPIPKLPAWWAEA